MRSFQGFLEQIATEGDFDSSGVFTLDVLAQQAKMRELHSQQGERWLLRLVQAANAAQSEQSVVVYSQGQLIFGLRTERPLPNLSTLDTAVGRDRDYLTYLSHCLQMLQAQDYSKVSVLQWQSKGPGQCLHWEGRDEAKVFELQSGLCDEMASQNQWATNGPFQAIVEIKAHPTSWFSRRVFSNKLHALLESAAVFSPVTLAFESKSYGQGVLDSSIYRWNESQRDDLKKNLGFQMACHQVVAPANEDIIVCLKEPGSGAQAIDAFGRVFDSQGPARNLFYKWSFSPEFPSHGSPMERTEDMRPFGDWEKSESALVPGLIPIAKEIIHERSHFKKVSTSLRLHSTYQLRGPIRPRAARGLPVCSYLALPKKPKGPGVLNIYRQGVLLDSQSVDLGVPGCVVHATNPQLATDAGGFSVVKDEVYETFLDHCRSLAWNFATECLELAPKVSYDVKALKSALNSFS